MSNAQNCSSFSKFSLKKLRKLYSRNPDEKICRIAPQLSYDGRIDKED